MLSSACRLGREGPEQMKASKVYQRWVASHPGQLRTKAGQGSGVLQQGRSIAKEQRTPVGKEEEEREKVNKGVGISILSTKAY